MGAGASCAFNLPTWINALSWFPASAGVVFGPLALHPSPQCPHTTALLGLARLVCTCSASLAVLRFRRRRATLQAVDLRQGGLAERRNSTPCSPGHLQETRADGLKLGWKTWAKRGNGCWRRLPRREGREGFWGAGTRGLLMCMPKAIPAAVSPNSHKSRPLTTRETGAPSCWDEGEAGESRTFELSAANGSV
jgi:hypothetical protein